MAAFDSPHYGVAFNLPYQHRELSGANSDSHLN
jgi:hypothetical protein